MDPLFFLDHMLGREGEGSILQVLKERKLARALNVGTSRQESNALENRAFTVTKFLCSV